MFLFVPLDNILHKSLHLELETRQSSAWLLFSGGIQRTIQHTGPNVATLLDFPVLNIHMY